MDFIFFYYLFFKNNSIFLTPKIKHFFSYNIFSIPYLFTNKIHNNYSNIIFSSGHSKGIRGIRSSIEIIHEASRKGEVPYSVGDPFRAQQILGWSP